MLYSLRGVQQAYGATVVLEIGALDLDRGKIYALVGPNGAGKTTLLRILSFLDAPARGSVLYNGRLVGSSEACLQPLRRETVLVNQRPVLFSTTVEKNVEFGLKVRGVARVERQRIVGEALEAVGLGHLAQTAARNLSGGETQRVALARAFALDPKVILFDEPTSNLDLETQNSIAELVRTINREKKTTIVLATHDRLQAATLGHQTLFLERGRLSSTSYENLFSARLQEVTRGRARCEIQGVVAVDLASEARGTRRVLLDPRRLTLQSCAAPTTDQTCAAPTTDQSCAAPTTDQTCAASTADQTCAASTADRAVMSGTVVQLAAEKEEIRLVVRGGLALTILMSAGSYNRQRPAVGERVQVEIPARAITVLESPAA